MLFRDLVISICMQDSLADLSETTAASYLVAHDLATGQVRWKSERMTGAARKKATPTRRRFWLTSTADRS